MESLAQISFGAIRCGFNTRFWARFRRVPKGSGADTCWGSGRFRCADTWWGSGRFRFWRVPVQIPVEVPESFGADSRWGSGGFRCRYLLRFRRAAQIGGEVPEGSSAEMCRERVEVLEGSGADTWWGSGGGFQCRYRVEVPKGSGTDSWWGSGGFRCRYADEVAQGSGAGTRWGSRKFRCSYLVRFQRVTVQIPCEVLKVPMDMLRFRRVPESSCADALWSSRGFRYFNGISI